MISVLTVQVKLHWHVHFWGHCKCIIVSCQGRLKKLHDEVHKRKLEIKEEYKQNYDKYNKVNDPDWKVGDLVLLQDFRVKPHSWTHDNRISGPERPLSWACL